MYRADEAYLKERYFWNQHPASLGKSIGYFDHRLRTRPGMRSCFGRARERLRRYGHSGNSRTRRGFSASWLPQRKRLPKIRISIGRPDNEIRPAFPDLQIGNRAETGLQMLPT